MSFSTLEEAEKGIEYSFCYLAWQEPTFMVSRLESHSPSQNPKDALNVKRKGTWLKTAQKPMVMEIMK